jgi:Sec-independent protein translocase protein TatA
VFGFSGGEILLIALIALILFGNDKLPENMKKMIKGFNQAKKVAKDVQNSWQDVKNDVQRSINFEEEKLEVQALINSSTVNMDIESSENYDTIHGHLAVPQEDIDSFQIDEIRQNNEEFVNHIEFSNSNEEIINPAFVTPNEYIMSKDFVGPRV